MTTNTANIIGDVLKQYLTKKQITAFVEELHDIPGNVDFRRDVTQLTNELKRFNGREGSRRRPPRNKDKN